MTSQNPGGRPRVSPEKKHDKLVVVGYSNRDDQRRALTVPPEMRRMTLLTLADALEAGDSVYGFVSILLNGAFDLLAVHMADRLAAAYGENMPTGMPVLEVTLMSYALQTAWREHCERRAAVMAQEDGA